MNKYAFPTLLIIVSIGLFVFYIDPTYGEVQKLKERSSQYDEALNKSKELRVVRDNLLKVYNSFSKESLLRIKKLLPNNVDNVRLIMDIDNIASRYGITIRGVSVETSSEATNSKKIQITSDKVYDFVLLHFTILSTYDNFINFITDLKNSLRLVDVIGVDFGLTKETSNLYKYNLSVKTYWLK